MVHKTWNTKIYPWLANIVTLFHGAWSVLVLGGVILVPFYHPYGWIQLVVLTITLFAGLIFDNDCPLTILEERLRKKTNPSFGGNKSFIATYFNKFLGTHITAREANAAIAVVYTLSYLSIAYALIHY